MPLEGSVAGFAARAADAAIQAPGSLPRRVPAGPRIEARPRFEASIGGHASMNKLVHAGPRIEAPDLRFEDRPRIEDGPRIEAPMYLLVLLLQAFLPVPHGSSFGCAGGGDRPSDYGQSGGAVRCGRRTAGQVGA